MKTHLLSVIAIIIMLIACSTESDQPEQPLITATLATLEMPETPPVFTPSPLSAAHNLDWTPQIETFDGVEMVLVPAGCLDMGNSEGEIDEVPVHRQCLEEPFYIDRYEVTNAQFERFGGIAAEASRWTDSNRPRDHVTWYEARAFCEERGARLPTEVEWEYAARGPDSVLYPWGNLFFADFVVYIDNSNSETAEVGGRPGGASWVGAFDMSGNVKEWVSTVYSFYLPYPYNAADGRENTQNTTDRRTQRGGGFLDPGNQVFAFSRVGIFPEYTGSDFGVRCARDYQ
jgi:sulfatase modifying factor 1